MGNHSPSVAGNGKTCDVSALPRNMFIANDYKVTMYVSNALWTLWCKGTTLEQNCSLLGVIR